MTTAPPPQQPYIPVPPPVTPSMFRQHFVALLAAGVVLVVTLAALAVWLFTSVLTAHPAATAPTAQAASPALPQSTSTTLTAQDQQFLGMLRALPDMPPVTNAASMVTAAHGVCSDLERGMGAGAESYSIAGQAGVSVNVSGEIVGASIMVYCPQYRAAAGL